MKLREPAVQLELATAQPALTYAFYRRLGLNPGPEPGTLTDIAGQSLHLVPGRSAPVPQRNTFYVRSLKYLKRQLVHAEIWACGPLPDLEAGLPGLLFRDPEGNLVRCLERPAQRGTELVAPDRPASAERPAAPALAHQFPPLENRTGATSVALIRFLRTLRADIQQLQTLMVEFSEGQNPSRNTSSEYARCYRAISRSCAVLERLGLPYPHRNPHEDLASFLVAWSGNLETPRLRRNYIVGLYAELTDAVEQLASSLSERVPPAALFPAIVA